jgi:hypothetical protein
VAGRYESKSSRQAGQSHYEGEEARGEGVEEETRKGIAVSDLEKFVFAAKRRELVVFEESEGDTAEDGKGFCGASGSDARVILQSAIALTQDPQGFQEFAKGGSDGCFISTLSRQWLSRRYLSILLQSFLKHSHIF